MVDEYDITSLRDAIHGLQSRLSDVERELEDLGATAPPDDGDFGREMLTLGAGLVGARTPGGLAVMRGPDDEPIPESKDDPLLLLWAKTTEAWSSGNTVAANPCENEEGDNPDATVALTLYIKTPISGDPHEVEIAEGDVLAYLEIAEDVGLIVSHKIVAGSMSWAKIVTPASIGGNKLYSTANPCSKDGTGTDGDTTVYVYHKWRNDITDGEMTVIPHLSANDVIPYLAFEYDPAGDTVMQPCGMLIGEWCLPEGTLAAGDEKKPIQMDSSGKLVVDWLYARTP